jgi:hypothetical protein
MTVTHIKPAQTETFSFEWGSMKWFVSPVTIPGAANSQILRHARAAYSSFSPTGATWRRADQPQGPCPARIAANGLPGTCRSYAAKIAETR